MCKWVIKFLKRLNQKKNIDGFLTFLFAYLFVCLLLLLFVAVVWFLGFKNLKQLKKRTCARVNNCRFTKGNSIRAIFFKALSLIMRRKMFGNCSLRSFQLEFY